MSQSPTRHFPFAKIVIFFAVTFGIGVGLCGLDFFLAAHHIGKVEGYGVGPLDGPSILIMLLSGIGLILTIMAWVISSAFFLLAHGSDSPREHPHTPDDSSDTDTHDSR